MNKDCYTFLPTDLYKSYKTLSDVVVRHRGYPPLEPVQYLGPPCLTQTILGRELQGTINQKHVVTNKFYSRIQLYFRSVGHLSAVYCMLFDRTGKYVHSRFMWNLRGVFHVVISIIISTEATSLFQHCFPSSRHHLKICFMAKEITFLYFACYFHSACGPNIKMKYHNLPILKYYLGYRKLRMSIFSACFAE